MVRPDFVFWTSMYGMHLLPCNNGRCCKNSAKGIKRKRVATLTLTRLQIIVWNSCLDYEFRSFLVTSTMCLNNNKWLHLNCPVKNKTHPNNTRPGRTAQLNGPQGTFRYAQLAVITLRKNVMLALTYKTICFFWPIANLKKIYCYRIKLQDQGVSSTERNVSEHLDNRYLQ